MIVGMTRAQLNGLGAQPGWFFDRPESSRGFGLQDQFIGGVPNRALYGGAVTLALLAFAFGGPTKGFSKAVLTMGAIGTALWAALPLMKDSSVSSTGIPSIVKDTGVYEGPVMSQSTKDEIERGKAYNAAHGHTN